MNKNCKNCSKDFEITESDRAFYKKIDVPEPTHCPDCRLQRRMAFRNERHIFKRKCDLCNDEIISFFRPNEEFSVYCHDCWWSDKWDPLKYGADFDFNRPFFEQYHELMMKVPKAGMLIYSCENSEYTSRILQKCLYVRRNLFLRGCLLSN